MGAVRSDTRNCPICGGVAYAEHRRESCTGGDLRKLEPFQCDCGWVEGTEDIVAMEDCR